MGLLDKLFGSRTPDYPPIDPQSPPAEHLAAVEDKLGELAGQVKDAMEVVPSERGAYVFLGKPPKRFGLAWIHDGEISGLAHLVKDHGLKPTEVGGVLDSLRRAYERSAEARRYTADVHGRTVVVTPSEQLEAEVHGIIEAILE